MSNIGLPEIAIVLVIVLVIFGPKRLPQLGKSLGSGMREFKDAVTGKNKDDEPAEIEDGSAPAQPAASTPAASSQPAPAAEPVTQPDDEKARAKAAEPS
jgi:sec-independent protein translocase protein TatA